MSDYGPRREPTKAEAAWIKEFDRICRRKPRMLKVFVANGSVCVILATPEGEMPRGGPHNDSVGVDSTQMVHQVAGATGFDGGDW